jgi:hypothetical protein
LFVVNNVLVIYIYYIFKKTIIPISIM